MQKRLQGEIGQAQQRDNTRDHQRDIKFFIRGHIRSVARGSWLAGIQSCDPERRQFVHERTLLPSLRGAALTEAELRIGGNDRYSEAVVAVDANSLKRGDTHFGFGCHEIVESA